MTSINFSVSHFYY